MHTTHNRNAGAGRLISDSCSYDRPAGDEDETAPITGKMGGSSPVRGSVWRVQRGVTSDLIAVGTGQKHTSMTRLDPGIAYDHIGLVVDIYEGTNDVRVQRAVH